MKKLLLILLFPLLSFSQDDNVIVENSTRVNNTTNIGNGLILSDEKTTIKFALTVDLGNYTDVLMVDVKLVYKSSWSGDYVFPGEYADDKIKHQNEYWFEPVENQLSSSTFNVQNPYKVSKKKFRKNRLFLKKSKDISYLYLYLNQTRGRGNDINTTIIIRDWKNKQIYNAVHINTGLNEILSPLIDY